MAQIEKGLGSDQRLCQLSVSVFDYFLRTILETDIGSDTGCKDTSFTPRFKLSWTGTTPVPTKRDRLSYRC